MKPDNPFIPPLEKGEIQSRIAFFSLAHGFGFRAPNLCRLSARNGIKFKSDLYRFSFLNYLRIESPATYLL